MLKQIFASIDQQYDEMVSMRRYLHQYPEVSFHEYKTAQYITNFYDTLDIPYKKNVGGNGVIATLKGGKPGKTIALRADFDALPIQDEKDVPYKSKIDGVMHACGHDGHTATLLTIAKVMKSFQFELPGTLVLIHQHAEELSPGGAKPMIEAGALDSVDAIFGTHLWAPAKLGELQVSKDILMAGSDRFEITIQGKGGHGASPHETKDAIVIGANLINQLQQIMSRRIDPLETAVITVGKFAAGQSFNIIAHKAEIVGTARYLNKAIQEQLIVEMEKVIKGVCLMYDATYTFNYYKGYPPIVNHPNETELVMEAGKEIDDIHTVSEVVPVMGGEDFSYYLQEKPGAFFFTGAQMENNFQPHHHPLFDIDERAMPIAAKTLIQAYYNYQTQ